MQRAEAHYMHAPFPTQTSLKKTCQNSIREREREREGERGRERERDFL